MLQQTQLSRVEPAFDAFIERFPTIERLAAATRADVVRAWAGLGYNRRAVSLHEAARAVVREYAGRLPRAAATLRTLPGVGPYTAAAVASIAFGAAVAAVDVNVRRTLARAVFGSEPDEVAPRALAEAAERSVPAARPGGWNQALMDLGREVCRPVPMCDRCPVRPWCAFVAQGRVGRPSARRHQPAFAGSNRQVRGRVVAALRVREPLRHADLRTMTGFDDVALDMAIRGLVRDGVIVTARGRVRLAR